MNARFGMFILPVVETDSSSEAHAVLQATVADVELAESVGLEAAWVAEHHGTPYGGVCPNGLMLLAYLAGKTSRIRLGTAASIVPLRNPVQLAEEALLIDHLSRGRLEMGVGRGFLPIDFATLGVEMRTRHQRFESGLEILHSALRPNHKGDAHLYPSLFQTQGIPLWGAAATSIESISMFAGAGMGIMLNPYTRSVTEIAEAIELYRTRFVASGYPPERARILIHEHLYAADSENLARDVPRPYLMSYLDSLRKASSEIHGGNHAEHSTGPQNYEELFPAKVAFGTPGKIYERISNWIACGVTDFAFSFRFGGLPSRLVRESLRLFGTKVAPLFQNGIREREPEAEERIQACQ